MQSDAASRDEIIRQLQALPTGGGTGGLPPELPPNRSGGSNPDMEPRVAKLEAHMEHVRSDLASLAAVPTDLAVLKERVSHLPTKGWMVSTMIATVASVGALIAFGEKLQALVR